MDHLKHQVADAPGPSRCLAHGVHLIDHHDTISVVRVIPHYGDRVLVAGDQVRADIRECAGVKVPIDSEREHGPLALTRSGNDTGQCEALAAPGSAAHDGDPCLPVQCRAYGLVEVWRLDLHVRDRRRARAEIIVRSGDQLAGQRIVQACSPPDAAGIDRRTQSIGGDDVRDVVIEDLCEL